MPYKKISFNEFTEIMELVYDPDFPEEIAREFYPFAWLLGAGVSVSSGIPLASGVSERIAVFEYLRNKKIKLWNLEDKVKIRQIQKDFNSFFDWWNKQTQNYQTEKISQAFAFLNKKYPSLKDHDPKSAIYYQELFEIVFGDKAEIQTIFLSALINAGKGINLAHLGLAGILRDFPHWGHTVLTTNFDDLLLRTILNIGYNARSFEVSEIYEKLQTKPRLPQIVYLHGKHTGYYTKNKPEDISNIDIRARSEIYKLLSNSNLIVLGYSGWQDIAKSALEELQDPKKERKGSIFWVPYKDESYITEDMKTFLNSFPSGRVYVIQNTLPNEKPLDADSFILSLCKYLNNKNGGIASYRSEFLNLAAKQHNSIFKQLDDYPAFNPKRGINLIKEAQEKYIKGEIEASDKLRQEVEELLLPDLPEIISSELNQAIGFFELKRKEYLLAEKYLTTALDSWQKLSDINDIAFQNIFDIRIGLAESKFNQVDFSGSREHLIRARHLVNKEQVVAPEKISIIPLFFAAISLYEGSRGSVKDNLKDFKKTAETLDQTTYPRLFAHYFFLQGTYHYHYSLSLSKVRTLFSTAMNLYEIAGQLTGKANCLKYLADLDIRDSKFEEARVGLSKCLKIYEEDKDELGKANISSSFGDLHFQKAILSDQAFLQKSIISSLAHHQKAIEIYAKNRNMFNHMNSITDWLTIHKHMLNNAEWGEEEMNKDDYKEYISQLEKYLEDYRNPYSKSRLDDLKIIENLDLKQETMPT